MTVSAPSNDSTLSVVKRIYYPQTGRGYLFLDYSTYGMARRVSIRKDMTGAGGTITDGTEIALYQALLHNEKREWNRSGL